MKTAPPPLNEISRLDALKSTQLLDTASEQEFDNLTFLASQICKTPISLISLVDKDRQWFKSKIGISDNETPRDFSFCAHTILQNEVFIVEDSHKDERFKDNPLVTDGPRVAFYAGAPVIDPVSKLPLGALCVIDSKARSLDKEQVKALRVLAEQFTNLLHQRHADKKMIELNKSLNFHTIAAENMNEGLLIQDKNGRLIRSNPSTLNILGMNSEDYFDQIYTDSGWQPLSVDGQSLSVELLPSKLIIHTGKPQKNVLLGFKTINQNEKWILVNSNPVYLEGDFDPSYTISTFSEVTELHLAQAKLIDNARLVSLAAIASGVAHEINNPLTVINGACSALNRTIESKAIDYPAIEKQVGKIKNTVVRISKIIKGLQCFARSAANEPKTSVNILEVFTDTLEMSAHRFKHSEVTIDLNVDSNLLVHANFIQLGQVIINLLNNSYDAISILNNKWIRIDAFNNETMTDIRITDSGNGIPAPVLDKMFLPFYTTKEIGKGTGLGLSLSKSLIEEMGGSLIYDPINNNTSFIVRLKTA